MGEDDIVVSDVYQGQTPYILWAHDQHWAFFKAGTSPLALVALAVPLLIVAVLLVGQAAGAGYETLVGPLRLAAIAVLAISFWAYYRHAKSKAVQTVGEAIAAAEAGQPWEHAAEDRIDVSSIAGVEWGIGARGTILIQDPDGTINRIKIKAKPDAKAQIQHLVDQARPTAADPTEAGQPLT